VPLVEEGALRPAVDHEQRGVLLPGLHRGGLTTNPCTRAPPAPANQNSSAGLSGEPGDERVVLAGELPGGGAGRA
jgi:hypothetical protein